MDDLQAISMTVTPVVFDMMLKFLMDMAATSAEQDELLGPLGPRATFSTPVREAEAELHTRHAERMLFILLQNGHTTMTQCAVCGYGPLSAENCADLDTHDGNPIPAR